MSRIFLLVEDEEDDTLLFERAWRKARLQNPLVKVRNGIEAALYLTGEGRFSDRAEFPFPSVMFLDLGLPGVSGLATLESIRASYPRAELLVVVLTGTDDLALAEKAFSLGADSFLVKPPKALDLLNLQAAFPDRF